MAVFGDQVYSVAEFPKNESHDNPGHSQCRPEFPDDVGGNSGIVCHGIEKTLDKMVVHGMQKHPSPDAS
jgi:hypothetical protein